MDYFAGIEAGGTKFKAIIAQDPASVIAEEGKEEAAAVTEEIKVAVEEKVDEIKDSVEDI